MLWLFTSERSAWKQLFCACPLPRVPHVQLPTSEKISQQICTQHHALPGNSAAPREPAQAFDECARCGYRLCESSDSSRILRPRPTSDRGSASARNDTE